MYYEVILITAYKLYQRAGNTFEEPKGRIKLKHRGLYEILCSNCDLRMEEANTIILVRVTEDYKGSCSKHRRETQNVVHIR